MQVALTDIKVKRRVREELYDIEELMDSMRRYGLLNPITLNSSMVLIAGQRRFEAAKRLGWTSINAVIVEHTDKITELELELEENTQRSNFTEQELLSGYARLEKLRNPGFFVKLWRAIVSFFRALFGRKD